MKFYNFHGCLGQGGWGLHHFTHTSLLLENSMKWLPESRTKCNIKGDTDVKWDDSLTTKILPVVIGLKVVYMKKELGFPFQNG